MNTEFLKKDGPVREAVHNHGNKIAHGLSASALIFCYATFAAKDDFRNHCQRCETIHVTHAEFDRERQDTKDSRSAIWRKVADQELRLDRLSLTR